MKPEHVNLIVVHCSATPPSMDIGAAEIDLWHRQRGWFGIGYHKVFRRDGTVEDGRPLNRPGAHARGFNHRSYGFVLVGGVAEDGKNPEDNFTDEQIEALRTENSILIPQMPWLVVVGHRDLPGVAKACPSFDVQDRFYGRRIDFK